MRRLLLSGLALGVLASCTTGPVTVDGPPRRIVFFTADSAALDDGARESIMEAAATAQANPSTPVRVRGFAAPDAGSASFNRSLATTRAMAVSDGLVQAGVAPSRVRIESRGAVPFEQMPTEARRVEILIGG